MSTPSSPPDRAGMTLVEIVIALTIFGVVIAGALGFVAAQNTAFHQSLDRMSVLRNARYVVESLARDLPTAGTNVPARQPSVVYAGEDVIAFSADYATNVANDVFAVYIDPDAPPGQVTVPTSALALPNTTVQWPDTLYETGAGTPSPAELVIFFFAEDSTTSRDDDYALFRQVNGGRPELVSNHLLPADDAPFLRYFRQVDFEDAASILDSIPPDSIPVHHTEPIHGSPDDQGVAATVDRIRAVRVSFKATNGQEGEAERTADVSRLIAMPNTGQRLLQTCGAVPLLGSALAVANAVDTNGDPVAELTWSPATDETGGERDVVRYVIYRQEGALGGEWGDPYLSVPAGQASYEYQDGTVESGEQYAYALAAQDCTPSLSELTTSNPITIP